MIKLYRKGCWVNSFLGDLDTFLVHGRKAINIIQVIDNNGVNVNIKIQKVYTFDHISGLIGGGVSPLYRCGVIRVGKG
jgi:hypothetical protein